MPVSVIFVRELVAALESSDRSADGLLSGLEIDRAELADLRTRVVEADFAQAVDTVSFELRDDALGLTLGERAPVHTLRLVSSLLLSSTSLRGALGTLASYAPLIADELEFALTEDSDQASLAFKLERSSAPGNRFVADYSVAMLVRMIRRFVGDAPATVRSVVLQHEPPVVNPVQALTGVHTLEFGQAQNEIVFRRSALDMVQPYADERAHMEYRDAADAVLVDVRRVASVADRVRSVLRSRAMLVNPSMKQVSTLIGLQPRTLARSLSAEGQSFRVLVDEARCLEACEALRQHLPIAEIAELVGFSEPSAFHRAFRRWTGQTPSQYARQATRART